jgi:hypothetical protein
MRRGQYGVQADAKDGDDETCYTAATSLSKSEVPP